MFSNKKKVVLCDIGSVVDAETGDRTIGVLNARKIIGSVDLVGVQTQQLAQLQNMNFQYSIVIDRMYYHNQKYLYMDNNLYKIGGLGKAKLSKDCTLNVVVFEDENIKNAIEVWLNGNI